MDSNHYTLDIYSIKQDKFLNGQNYINIFKKIIDENNGTYVGSTFYDFVPHGTTVVLLLAESHLSIHTFPELEYASLDIYTCGKNINTKKIVNELISFFESSKYKLQEIARPHIDNSKIYDNNSISCTQIQTTNKLTEIQSKFQNIKLFQTKSLGKLLLMDDIIQLVENKSYYNEMMAHIPMNSHPNPKNILIIGGGDGYILNEVLKYNVDNVYLVDIDEEIIKLSKKEFTKWNKCWEDPRLHLKIEDGKSFCSQFENNFFDVIIQDSSDPFDFQNVNKDNINILSSNTLFSEDHFINLKRVMRSDGVAIIQAECFHNASEWIKELIVINKQIWSKEPVVGLIYEPVYAFGTICFLGLTNYLDITNPISNKTIDDCSVYNSDYHKAAFVLPNEIRKFIRSISDQTISQTVINSV